VKFLTLLVLIVSGAAFAVAQERAIDKAKFDAAVNGTDAHKITWAGQSYRIEVTSSAKILGRPESCFQGLCKPDSDHTAKMIIEFGPARTVRSFNTNTFGGKTTSSEILRFGELLYKRENGGPWSVTTKQAAASADDRESADNIWAPPTVLSSDITYFLIGNERFREGTATVFRKVEKTREMDASTGAEFESVSTEVYWIVDGVQRRHELLSQRRSAKLNSNNTVKMEWNLDPSITFAAPEIIDGK